MKVLVTGASGMVGSHVVDALLAAGHEPVALVRPTSNVEHLQGAGVELRHGDVTDPPSLRRACQRVDCVVHTAAVVSTYGGWEHYRRVGVQGTANVVDAAAAQGVERFVHISSIAVYGFAKNDGKACDESTPYDQQPESWNHYVREKVLSEQLVWRRHAEGRVRATALRPSVILGPRDRTVLTRALRYRLLTVPLGSVMGTGKNRIPCVVVEELADAIVRAATRDVTVGQSYNLSGRDTVTQAELTAAYVRAAGGWMTPARFPRALSALSATLLDHVWELAGMREEPLLSRLAVTIYGYDYRVVCERARRDLGWQGSADYFDAIRRSVEWYQAHAAGAARPSWRLDRSSG